MSFSEAVGAQKSGLARLGIASISKHAKQAENSFMHTDPTSLPVNTETADSSVQQDRINYPKSPTDDRFAIAIHESAHAVIAAIMNILPDEATVSIVPDEKGELGSVNFGTSVGDFSTQWNSINMHAIVLALLAGPAATLKLYPDVNLLEEGGYYESDMIFSEFLLERCVNGLSWDSAWKEAAELVEQNWSRISAVANAVMRRSIITGTEVKSKLKRLSK